MLRLHPSIVQRDGKKTFVMLPYEEFLSVQEELEVLADLRCLRAAKAAEGGTPGVPLSEARRILGIRRRPSAPSRRSNSRQR